MSRTLDAQTALDRYFLETRCKIIEIAANMDRIAEGSGGADSAQHDPRFAQIQEAIRILTSDSKDKAAACQLVFSQDYEDGWNAPNA